MRSTARVESSIAAKAVFGSHAASLTFNTLNDYWTWLDGVQAVLAEVEGAVNDALVELAQGGYDDKTRVFVTLPWKPPAEYVPVRGVVTVAADKEREEV